MKKITYLLLAIAIMFGTYYVWHVHFNYRLESISEGKVYKSALIKDKDTLEKILLDKNIKTVIDLLEPDVQDRLNPGTQNEIDREDKYINDINAKNNTNIQHINIPSTQVPNEKTLKQFFEVLDNQDNYPVLIHCYHGTGRAQIYSAIYRIEYENWSNEDARAKTRFIVEAPGYKSSFAEGKGKGDFLINYKPRPNSLK